MKLNLFLICLLPILFLFCSTPIHAHASSSQTEKAIETGYTSQGIYYEIYIIDNFYENLPLNVSSHYITRVYVYYDTITPANSITHVETIGGIIYSGTLKLTKYQWISGKTHAYYEGYIYPQS